MDLMVLILTGKSRQSSCNKCWEIIANRRFREYPVAPERGGKDADLANYPKFLQNLRNALDQSGMPSRPGLSITIVSKTKEP